MSIPVLPEETLERKDFPASPKRTWKAALAAEPSLVKMTFVVGDWLTTDLRRVLVPEMASLCLWVIRGDGRRAWCSWHRKEDRWSFWTAVAYDPLANLSHKEFMAWLPVPPR